MIDLRAFGLRAVRLTRSLLVFGPAFNPHEKLRVPTVSFCMDAQDERDRFDYWERSDDSPERTISQAFQHPVYPVHPCNSLLWVRTGDKVIK